MTPLPGMKHTKAIISYTERKKEEHFMRTVIHVLKHDSVEERVKNFTILFAKLIREQESNRYSQNNLRERDNTMFQKEEL